MDFAPVSVSAGAISDVEPIADRYGVEMETVEHFRWWIVRFLGVGWRDFAPGFVDADPWSCAKIRMGRSRRTSGDRSVATYLPSPGSMLAWNFAGG